MPNGPRRLVVRKGPLARGTVAGWLVAVCALGTLSCSQEPLRSEPLPEVDSVTWQPAPASLLDTRPIGTRTLGDDGVLDVLGEPQRSELLWSGWEQGGEPGAPRSQAVSGRGGGMLRFLVGNPVDLELCLEVRSAGALGASSLVVVLNGNPLAERALEAEPAAHCAPLPAERLLHGPNWLEFHHPGAAQDASRLGAVFEQIRIRGFAKARAPQRARVGSARVPEELAYLQRGTGSFAVLLALPQLAELHWRAAWISEGAQSTVEAAIGQVRIVQDSGTSVLWQGALAAGEESAPIRVDLGAFRERAAVLIFGVSNLSDGATWAWIDPQIVRRAPSELERQGLPPPWVSETIPQPDAQAAADAPLGRAAPAVRVTRDPQTGGQEFRFAGFRERADPAVAGGRRLLADDEPDVDRSRDHAVTLFFLTQWRFAFTDARAGRSDFPPLATRAFAPGFWSGARRSPPVDHRDHGGDGDDFDQLSRGLGEEDHPGVGVADDGLERGAEYDLGSA